MAGEFAVHVRDGDVYSVEEVRAWLAETGWRFESHVPLTGPQSLIVATATDEAQWVRVGRTEDSNLEPLFRESGLPVDRRQCRVVAY